MGADMDIDPFKRAVVVLDRIVVGTRALCPGQGASRLESRTKLNESERRAE